MSETVIQKAGNDRIIVDIPGIDDRERAIETLASLLNVQVQRTSRGEILSR